MTRIEVLSTPAEFEAAGNLDLSMACCVVFDVLRATTSMITALAEGAEAILPVAGISEALTARHNDSTLLLAGERNGWRIRAEQSGGVEFDFGNSPREFVGGHLSGRRLVMTTTNGTRALRAVRGARLTLVSSFLNLQATAQRLRGNPPTSLLLVGSGTFEEAALEDTLAAGALADSLWDLYANGHVADSATIARQLHQTWRDRLAEAMPLALNGRRLLAQPELRDDVTFSLQRDRFPIVVRMDPDGWVRRG